MESIAEDHIVLTIGNEPMVMGRDLPSVSFLTSTLSFSAYPPVPLVPSFVGLHPKRSMRPEEHSKTLDRLRGFVSILSRIHAGSLHIKHTANVQLRSFQ